MSEPIRQFRGSANKYVAIGTRGPETIGLGLEYSPHYSGVGAFILRFAVHSSTGAYGTFTHFISRFTAKFLELTATGDLPLLPDGAQDHSKEFEGTRLNKFAIPVFKPVVPRHEALAAADYLNVWVPLAAWVQDQLKLEGFTVSVEDLPAVLRSLLVPPAPKVTDMNTIGLVLEFPDLAAHKAHVETKAKSKPPKDDADEDEDDADDPDDDDNGDDADGEKGWLQ